MATSIVTVQLGHCGALLGNKFWEIVINEHGLDRRGVPEAAQSIQLDKIRVYFQQSTHGNNVPRSIFVDLDGTTLDQIRSSHMSALYRPDNFVAGSGSASNNWAKGHYTDGAEHADTVMELLRKESEECDCLQGFQFIHSIGGGSGSGLGIALMRRVQDEYPDKLIASFTVYPSPKVSEVVVEPYNAVLSISQMVECTDETFVLDNEGLYNIAHNTMKMKSPSLSDLNHIISFVLSGITTCLRFPGQLNADLRKLGVNMVPFPRLHFFVPGYAPLYAADERRYKALTVPELTQQMLDPKNMMAACNPRAGKYLTAACVFRGLVSTKDVEQSLSEAHRRSSKNFVPWIPNNMTRAICDIAAPGQKITATFLGNTTALRDVLIRIMKQYSAMYKRNAFLHWYLGEGMDEAEFPESESNVKDLIEEYQLYDTAT